MNQEEINKKAEELVNAMIMTDSSMCYDTAKRCALRACDEILKEYAVLQIETSYCYKFHLQWVAIKQAIENL